MKTLFLILALAVTASAQDWKLIKEISGEIPNHPGLTIETYAAEIARDEDIIKLKIRFDLPYGPPVDWFQGTNQGFDVSTISRLEVGVRLDCKTLVITTPKGSSDVYRSNGQKLKSKEPPFAIKEGHVFEKYFCERGEKPTKAPTLKPK
jgi:hypothetical protein